MIRTKDVVVLVAMAWLLLRDSESSTVSLTQTCVDAEGNRVTVPLGDCPEGYTLEIINNQSPSSEGLGGCGCGERCGDCA